MCVRGKPNDWANVNKVPNTRKQLLYALRVFFEAVRLFLVFG